jgi:hypothetical protein
MLNIKATIRIVAFMKILSWFKEFIMRKMLFLLPAAFLILAACELFYPPAFYEGIVLKALTNEKPVMYVSVLNGNDANSGTNKSEPLKNIQTAILKSTDYGFSGVLIKTAAGFYSYSSNGLTASFGPLVVGRSDVTIVGGFDESFSSKAGATVLDTAASYRVVDIQNVSRIVLDGLVIQNGNGNPGSGAFVNGGEDIHIRNCVFNNQMNGEVLSISNTALCVLDNLVFTGNSAVPLSISGGNTLARNCKIVSNSINGNSVVSIGPGASVRIFASVITNNTSSFNQYVLYAEGPMGFLHLEGNTFGGANTNYHAIYISNSVATLEIVKNAFQIDKLMTVFYKGFLQVGNIAKLNQPPFIGASVSMDNFIAPGSVSYLCVSSTTCNETNGSGSSTLPLRHIQEAIDLAALSGIDDVRVETGLYSNGGGLNNLGSGLFMNNDNIHLSGGWIAGFISHSGYSELDMGGSANSVIQAANCSNISIDGFIIRNGHPFSANGGGVSWNNVSYSVISNCVLSNNVSSSLGGGMCLENCSFNTLSLSIISNSAVNGGGGVSLLYGNSNIIQGIFNNNLANYGGGIYINASYNVFINADFLACVSGNMGGSAIYLYSSTNIKIFNSLMSNCPANGATKSVMELYAPVVNLELTNNRIGGTDLFTYGIMEYAGDISGQKMVDNIFLTNNLGYLYYDTAGPNTISCDASWGNINNPAMTGASFASGNGVLP